MKNKLKKALKKLVKDKWITIHPNTTLDDVVSLMDIIIRNEELNEIGHKENCDCQECHHHYGKVSK